MRRSSERSGHTRKRIVTPAQGGLQLKLYESFAGRTMNRQEMVQSIPDFFFRFRSGSALRYRECFAREALRFLARSFIHACIARESTAFQWHMARGLEDVPKRTHGLRSTWVNR